MLRTRILTWGNGCILKPSDTEYSVFGEIQRDHCQTWLLSYVTGSEKTAHFVQDFKIELLVLQDRVALKQ